MDQPIVAFEFMSYLPLLPFGPSATVPGSAYRLPPPFGSECLTSLADDMTYYALCSTLPCGQTTSRYSQSPKQHGQISWGKLSRLPCTIAGSTLASLMDMDFAVSGPLVRRSRLVPGSCP